MNDAITRRYFVEGEQVSATGSGFYYARDHLGSVRDVLEAQSGSMVASYDYDPYGRVTQASGQVLADFRYAQMLHHRDSDLYLTHYRAYNPRTGSWLSRDPLREAAGINLYAYVDRDPINHFDPSGLAGTTTHGIHRCEKDDSCEEIMRKIYLITRSLKERKEEMVPFSISGQPYENWKNHKIQIEQQCADSNGRRPPFPI